MFNKDHTSILYSFNKIAKLSKDENPEIFEDIEVIKERLGKYKRLLKSTEDINMFFHKLLTRENSLFLSIL